jgi:AcrR family transcriptional regulator
MARVGRPRRVEDEQVFAAMAAVLLRVGWARMTTNQVAAEVGVTPAALRQRFGGKRDLFAAFYAWHTRRLRADAAAPPGAGSALDTLRATVRGSVAGIATPAQMRHAISPWTEVGEAPDIQRMTGERFAAALDQTTALLERAQEQGEIAGADPARLARQLRDCLLGTSLVWSVAGTRPVAEELADTVEQVLAPYVRRTRPSSTKGS